MQRYLFNHFIVYLSSFFPYIHSKKPQGCPTFHSHKYRAPPFSNRYQACTIAFQLCCTYKNLQFTKSVEICHTSISFNPLKRSQCSVALIFLFIQLSFRLLLPTYNFCPPHGYIHRQMGTHTVHTCHIHTHMHARTHAHT